jgi:uncharacterized repeat protein (TIGR03803 family)
VTNHLAATALRVGAFALAVSPATLAQTHEVVHDFEAALPAGALPLGPLTLGLDGRFYGVTTRGGGGAGCPAGCGTIFRLDGSGTVTTIHEFAGGDEAYPAGPLLLASDGNFYGVIPGDGSPESCLTFCGAVYRIDTDGNYAVIHNFGNDDGFGVNLALVEPQPGDIWGTTIAGPVPGCADGDSCGTVFRLHFDGGLETMHTFAFDEANWPAGGLVLGDDGSLYGATTRDPNGLGTVFRITTNGSLTTLHNFDTDCAGVIQSMVSVQGDLVGACSDGGSGAIFRLALDGTFQVIHSLAVTGEEGSAPATPMQGGDGLLYGVTGLGGAHGAGTIYQLGLTGAFAKLHDFDPPLGENPGFGLVQSPDGRFYGTTPTGGAHGEGTIYRLTMPGLSRYYCPDSFVRRDQMAVFLLKIAHGAGYTPPSCAGIFPDVACPSLFADWIEELSAEGITGGCGGGSYCPLAPVTRAQMAVFLLKTEHGAAYTPPSCAGIFPDVACPSLFANWIEQLDAEAITGGCGGGNYCPHLPVTRAQMAAFLLKVEHGGSYEPPACGPLFADVTCPSLFAPWIEQLYTEHITAGCAGPP